MQLYIIVAVYSQESVLGWNDHTVFLVGKHGNLTFEANVYRLHRSEALQIPFRTDHDFSLRLWFSASPS